MTPFESWADGLEWGEETLEEQRERLVKLVLSPDELAYRESMKKQKVNKQLELFI